LCTLLGTYLRAIVESILDYSYYDRLLAKFYVETRLSTVRTVVPTSTAQETTSAASVSTTESNVTGHITLFVTVVKSYCN